MTAIEHNQIESSPSQTTGNRIRELLNHAGPEYFAGILIADDYDINDDEQRLGMRARLAGLPAQMTVAEVEFLESQIHWNATLARAEQPGRVANVQRATTRTLAWIGDASLSRTVERNDEVTIQSVSELLRHRAGIRSKVAAAALWWQRVVEY
jgi:hypothetical protein